MRPGLPLWRLVLLLVVLPGGLAALDFGVSVGAAGEESRTPGQEFDLAGRTVAWLSVPGEALAFEGEITADAALSLTTDTLGLNPGRLDLGHCSVSGKVPWANAGGVLVWRAGRSDLRDLSTWVASGLADGISLDVFSGNQAFSARMAYTGLVLTADSRVGLSDADRADADAAAVWAPRRVVGALTGSFRELAFDQDLEVEVVGQKDLRTSESVDSLYATAKVSGPLADWGKWSGGVTAEAVQELTRPGYAGLAFVQGVLGSTRSLTQTTVDLLTSGALGEAKGFSPLAPRYLSVVDHSLVPDHTAVASLDWSVRPVAKMTTGVKAGTFLRTTTWAYLGSEASFHLDWRMTSETQVSGSAGIFLPPDGAGSPGERLYRCRLALILEF